MSDVESVATSPPSSVAPHSDDEFTTALVRHAARQLGVEFSGSLYRPTSTATHREEADLIDEKVPLLHTHNLNEIQRQIELRKKALGAKHKSIADLHTVAAKLCSQDRQPSRAEHHYTAALDILEDSVGSVSSELIPLLSSLAQFYVASNNFFNAKIVYQRLEMICESCHLGSERKVPPRADESGAALKKALLSWKQTKGDGAVFSALASSAASAVPIHRPHDRSTASVEVQASEDDAELDRRVAPVMSLDISEEQRERLKAPSMRTAGELRRLVEYVKAPQNNVASATARIIARNTSPRRSVDATGLIGGPVAAMSRQAAVDLQETLRRIRQGQ